MTDKAAIETRHLFRPLHASLIELLRGLADPQWELHCAGTWTVRDVTAHLLDVDLRRISVDRDGHRPPPPDHPIAGYADLVRYLNGLNAQWVTAARRLSPRVQVDLLDTAGSALVELMEAGRSEGEATYPVSWAGQDSSPMWLDVAREYTERWHHQDQIRDAVAARPLDAPELLRPVIEVSLLAVPVALAAQGASDGAVVRIRATGAAGGTWHFEHAGGVWRAGGAEREPAAAVECTDLDLARVLMHRIPAAGIADVIRTSGDANLAQRVTAARAVMV